MRKQQLNGYNEKLLFNSTNAGAIAVIVSFAGKLAAAINTIPEAVVGGLSICLFGMIAIQGIALFQSKKVDLISEPKNYAIGAIVLITGIGGSLKLPQGLYPFKIPVVFPNGIPAIVFCAICGIMLNLIFTLIPPKAAE